MDAGRLVPPIANRTNFLAGRRRSAWEHGALSIVFAWSLGKLANHQDKLGGRMRPLDEYWGVARREIDRVRRRSHRSERFKAHSIIKPRPFEAGAPSVVPAGDEDPPGLPSDVDRIGGNINGPGAA